MANSVGSSVANSVGSSVSSRFLNARDMLDAVIGAVTELKMDVHASNLEVVRAADLEKSLKRLRARF